jgi:CDP-paratose 2-epimerase
MASEKILVTGGAGFIGSNLVAMLLEQGHQVTVFDNLSRAGCNANIAWLRQRYGNDSFTLYQKDLSEYEALCNASRNVTRVYHLAGQVAVTSSVRNPRQDFEDNALGTFNALEAVRHFGDDPIFIFASTNKVYGGMEDLKIVEHESRYYYAELPNGVSESQPLDFHSPYGCSKGAADQYVRDYHRIYGLRSVVVRQSCIYGYRQFGIEDQGWLAWFMIAALKDRPIRIYGDGKQVRDILFVDDLLAFYDAAVQHIEVAAGQIYNVGGGHTNSISIWCEFQPMIEHYLDCPITVNHADWRPGDQRVYVSDIRKAERELGWKPLVDVARGTKMLFDWIGHNQQLFHHL